MNLEFLVWILGIASGNLFVTVPLYLITSFAINKKAKHVSNPMIISVNFAIVLILMLILNSFTIANTVTIFSEIFMLTWIGNVLYFDKRNKADTL